MYNEIENFLHNIKYLRMHYGLSKEKMAEIIQISTDNIDMIEQGEMPDELTASVIFYIYKHFGILPKNQFTERL